MTKKEEDAYARGQETLANSLLSDLLPHLKDGKKELARAVLELNEVRASLHRLSKDLQCDNWSDNLALADVVTKYIKPAIDDIIHELSI